MFFDRSLSQQQGEMSKDSPPGNPDLSLKNFYSRCGQICSVDCKLYPVTDCAEVIQHKQFF